MLDPRRTLPVNEEMLLKWRVLLERGRKVGHTFSQPDLLIAATGFNPTAQAFRSSIRQRVYCATLQNILILFFR